ncbi:MAG: TlyA family RNA methyltransferase [Candidatus Gracilibacteria bacterium]|nr:TlyA family RNA methyltransferase [Candidatus Gracilibacteria bacterium]
MKKRLDEHLVENELSPTRSQARNFIKDGFVKVNGNVQKKPGYQIGSDDTIWVQSQSRYASRGGFKLEAALKEYNIDPTGLNCLDVGASTGGFTDCLLQNGADHVTAIDVGTKQLIDSLKNDPRVTSLENTNIKSFGESAGTSQDLSNSFQLAVIDVSFISLTQVLEHVKSLIKPTGQILALFKPQFEGGPEALNNQGVVREQTKREKILRDFLKWCKEQDYQVAKPFESPIIGKKGNHEYFLLISQGIVS